MNKFLMSAMMLMTPMVAMTEARAATKPTPTPTPAPVPTNFTAGATTYSTRDAFAAAAGTTVTDDFNIASATDGGIGDLAFPSGVYVDPNGTSFAAPTNGSVVNLNILDTTYLNGSNFIQSHFGSDVLTSNTEALTVTFATPVTAFGIDYASFGRGFVNQSDLFSFTIPGFGTQQLYSNSSGTTNFFGVTTTGAFSSITITSATSGVSHYFDNATISAAPIAAVPEPATWLTMIFGMGAIGLAMRSAKRRSDGKFDAKIKRISEGALA